MLKRNLLKTAALVLTLVTAVLFSACESGSGNTDPTSSPTATEDVTVTPEPQGEVTPAPTEAPEDDPTEKPKNTVAKINGGADDVGIYAIVVRLTDQAADKGKVELVYQGAKGSPQENSVVNTFVIEYYKEDAGTFEIKTFFDGEVYLNQHHKDEVKVTNEFGANLRAGNVTITYTPDGGETQEIFRADADYFR